MTLEPAVRDQVVLLDGRRIHYREWGTPDAPALVILHGINGAAQFMDPIAAGLADQLHIVVPDLRGHGESDWSPPYSAATFGEDLEQLVERLHLSRVMLLGQSLGGTIGYHYAARYPARVKRLILGDIGPDSFSTTLLKTVITNIAAQAREVFDDPQEAVRRALANPGPTAPKNQDAVAERVVYNLVQGADGRWRWRYDAAGLGATHPWGGEVEQAAWEALAQVRCPTLIVRGEISPVLSRDNAERMVQILADGRWVELPDTSHGLPYDNPLGLLALVRPFLLEQSA